MADDAPSDWSDPCIVAAWLRPKVVALATGGAALRVRRANGSETQFGPGDLKAATALLASYDAACAKKNGDCSNRRRAIWFG